MGLGCILALTSAACGQGDSAAAAAVDAAPRVDVSAIRLAPTDIESALEISGTLMPQARVAVMATLPGTLSRVAVNIGDRVRRGQTVAVMDRRELDAQVDAAMAAIGVALATLESAEATLANALLERDRTASLFENGAVARQRLDAAATTYRSAVAQRELAKATVAQTEAAFRRAREVQRDATLTAPIDGVVVERNYDAGSLVSPSSDRPVVVVADLRVLKLEAGVSELEAGRLRVGMPARLSIQARPGEQFEGRLAAIAPEVDAKNRHFAIEIRTNNPDGTLLSGMYGVATIPLARVEKTIAVPRDAIRTAAGRRVVMKVAGDTVVEVPVTEGLASGTAVQIADGLSAGDVIVADARRDVSGGVKVNAIVAP